MDKRPSENPTFIGISIYSINAAQRSIVFYFLALVEMFRFYYFYDSLDKANYLIDIMRSFREIYIFQVIYYG